MDAQKNFLPIQDRHKIIYRLLNSENSFPIEVKIYCRLLPCRGKPPWFESDHRKRWRTATWTAGPLISPPQGTSNGAMVHHDAWTASFPQPPPALGSTLFSLFLRLGNRSWFQQKEDNQMTDSGPFPMLWPQRWVAFHLQEGVFIWMISAAHFPEGYGRKKSSHLCVGALHRLAQTDVADSASQICHYFLPVIFLGRFPKLCRPSTARRRKRTLFFLLKQRKILCCTREKLVCHTREAVALSLCLSLKLK